MNKRNSRMINIRVIYILIMLVQGSSMFTAAKSLKTYDSSFDSTLANRFQQVLDTQRDSLSLIGISAAVIMPEQGTWLGVSGMSDPVTGDTIRPDMLFGIASNTKTFVAAVILKLVDEGLLTLDDPLHQWLPTFQNIDSTITIRQLLNHTHGVHDYRYNPAWMDSINADLNKVWTPEYTLSFVLEPYFPPGTNFKYGNTGYILAGMIIREVADEDKFVTLLRQKILNPLNINNTFVDVEETLVGELAHSWLDIDNDEELDDMFLVPRTAIYSCTWTAGAIFSTAEDMARWVRALYSGQVLNQNSMNEMFSLVPVNWGEEFGGYGLGTEKWLTLGEELWAHAGNGDYSSFAVYLPRLDISIVVLINNYTKDMDIPVKRLLKVILDFQTPVESSNDSKNMPKKFTLHQNYPNPFNPSTTITFDLPKTTEVTINIFNLRGQLVTEVFNGRKQPGFHSVTWSPSNFSSGIYFIRMMANDFVQTKKCILLK